MNVSLRIIIILFLLAGSLGQTAQVHGQAGSAILFSTPEIETFPTIRFYFDPFDSEGTFINGLGSGDVQVIEDGRNLTPQSVEMIDNGLQIIIALNTSPALGNQVNGVTGYQRIQQALQGWAASLPNPSLDDFSLSTPTGLHLIRSRDPQKLNEALAVYQPDLQKNQPTLNSLSEALDLATDPLGRPLVKRSILFITPALPSSNISNLPDLAVRAQEIGVRVNVWMIGKPVDVIEGTPDPLSQFAETTGGKYFQIVSTEALPPIEPLFLPFRHTYRVDYQSAIQTSGTHSLKIKVNNQTTSITSDEARFSLNVQPPNPIFLSPPTQIHRTWQILLNDQETSTLSPDDVPLQIVVEFPDGQSRPLQSTRLYVDGILTAENTSEPFDHFNWSIADITLTGQKMIRVDVVDSLGLSGSSMEIPVEILVDLPVKARMLDRISDSGLIAIAAVAVSGTVLALILVFTNTQRRAGLKRQRANKKLNKDPLTQPVKVQPVPIRKNNSLFGKNKSTDAGASFPWIRTTLQSAPARLVALDENEQPITGGNLPLSRQEVTFGTDPKRATQVLNSASVDGLHARLYRSPEGDFFLADQNSIAGTWINFAPVTNNGARLEHGDLIHIGRVMFRFELTDPSKVTPAQIKVSELEQSHDPR